MSIPETSTEWPVLKESDPPLDLTREDAAYEKERERLLREHAGSFSVLFDVSRRGLWLRLRCAFARLYAGDFFGGCRDPSERGAEIREVDHRKQQGLFFQIAVDLALGAGGVAECRTGTRSRAVTERRDSGNCRLPLELLRRC